MHSVNLLTLIAEHLAWRELLNYSLLSRTCYQIAQSEEFWKREVLRLFPCIWPIYGYSSHSDILYSRSEVLKGLPGSRWKLIMKKSITAQGNWRTLLDLGLRDEELQALGEAVFEILTKEPMPPSPPLRREAHSLSSPLQDFWAYGHSDSYPIAPDFPFDIFFSSLAANLYELKSELETQGDWELLAVARWHATSESSSRISTASSSLTASDLSAESPTAPDLSLSSLPRKLKTARPALLRVYYCLKKTVSCKCQLVLRVLQDCRDKLALLSTYVNLWNAYCAAALRLHQCLKPYADLIQEIYEEKWPEKQGPGVTIVRMMVLAWRKKVFAPLETALMESVKELLCKQRKNAVAQAHNPPPRAGRCMLEDPEVVLLQWYSLPSAFQSIIDLSVHEISVFFLDHSRVLPDQPYLSLHTSLLALNFLQDLTPDPLLFQRCSQADLKLLRQLVPVATLREMEAVYAKQEAALWESHFRTLFAGQWVHVASTSLLSEHFLYSEFGLMLFQASSNKATAQAFIDYLLAVNPRHQAYIERYLELLVDFPTKYALKDEQVDYEAGRLGLHHSQLPSALFSLWKDVKVEDLWAEDMQLSD